MFDEDIFIIDIYKQYVSLVISSFGTRIDSSSNELLIDNIFKIKYIIFLLIPFVFLIKQNLKKLDLRKEKNYFLDSYLFFGLMISSIIHESYTDNQSVTFGLLPIYAILILSLIKENKSKILFYIFCILTVVAVLLLINVNKIYLDSYIQEVSSIILPTNTTNIL